MFRPCWTTAGLAAFLLLAGLVPPGPGQGPVEDYTSTDPEKLGVKLVTPVKDPQTGFVVGGKNATALIRTLPQIAGRKIAALEKDMRPGALSRLGFLGKDEKLLDVLAMDNVHVVEELGLTHQELARHLHVVGAIGRQEYVKAAKAGRQPPETEFRYHGKKFKVKAAAFRGYQDSPFDDGTKTNSEATVWNLDNGKKLHYSLLLPDMIERYGFYEGKGTPYRVEPRAILEVFDFIKPAKSPK
jgi:hypothetical protein